MFDWLRRFLGGELRKEEPVRSVEKIGVDDAFSRLEAIPAIEENAAQALIRAKSNAAALETMAFRQSDSDIGIGQLEKRLEEVEDALTDPNADRVARLEAQVEYLSRVVRYLYLVREQTAFHSVEFNKQLEAYDAAKKFECGIVSINDSKDDGMFNFRYGTGVFDFRSGDGGIVSERGGLGTPGVSGVRGSGSESDGSAEGTTSVEPESDSEECVRG